MAILGVVYYKGRNQYHWPQELFSLSQLFKHTAHTKGLKTCWGGWASFSRFYPMTVWAAWTGVKLVVRKNGRKQSFQITFVRSPWAFWVISTKKHANLISGHRPIILLILGCERGDASSATQVSGPHDALTRNKSSPTRRARAPPTGSGSALSSGPHGWGPAVPTEIWSPQLRPGSAHWARSSGRALPAVEVRQCPLRSGVCCWEERREGRKEEVHNSNNTISRPSPDRWGKTRTPHKDAGTQKCGFHGFPTFSNIFQGVPMFGECLPATLALQAAARPQRAESHRAAPRTAERRAGKERGCCRASYLLGNQNWLFTKFHKCSQNIARSCQQKIY